MRETALVFRRLHVLIEAGVPLHDSVSYLERGEPNPALKKVLDECHATLLKGLPLSAGMKQFPAVFSALSVELVSTGEKTGALSASLQQLSILYERLLDRMQRAKGALTYPLCLLVIMVLVIILFITFVAPKDSGIFAVLGDDIPWPSRVLITLSEVVTSPALVMLAAVAVAALALALRRLYFGNAALRQSVDGHLLLIPVLGPLLSRLESARVLDVLGSSLNVGIPIVASLGNSARVATNRHFRADLHKAIEAIMQGDGVGVALARHTSIPRFATSLIEVGEASGTLDDIVGSTSRILDEDVNQALTQAVKLAEPILLAIGGAAAGFVAVATLMPVMRLVSTL